MSKEQLYQRYQELLHAMQSGIAWLMTRQPSLIEPKHLRVGLNARAVDHGALVALLIEKRLFTEEEYAAKLVEFAEREVHLYETELAEVYGTEKVTLQ